MEKNLQALNRQEKIAVWSERVPDCRNTRVKAWCEGNSISPSNYYKWQKNLFSLAAQSPPQFAEMCALRRKPEFRLLCAWGMCQ